MSPGSDNPLIVQADLTVLLEVASKRAREARAAILPFAELVKAPEHVHTYRITALSIWNARAAGVAAEAIAATLHEFARYAVPENVEREVQDLATRFGRLELRRFGEELVLSADQAQLMELLSAQHDLRDLLQRPLPPRSVSVDPENRGRLKRVLIDLGWPVRDLAGYTEGEPLELRLRSTTRAGCALELRDYQRAAAEDFHAAGSDEGGSGVVVLPCGAGKTLVGIAAMQALGTSTLVLTTSTTAVRQWIAEVLDKTTLEPEQVGEYTGATKDVRPVTVATYSILTNRNQKSQRLEHLELFDRRNWGLIVYDEVHLLPAPVFQITAGLQARRRLGLTATLVREDGREDEVFALIGPKCADVPWKELEEEGWIATARCVEVRLPLEPIARLEYARCPERSKHRFAAENPAKFGVVAELLENHPDDQALIIGTYVEQVKQLAQQLEIPCISGQTSQKRRDELFGQLRSGELRAIAVTKVANFAIDLPDVSLAIQISGTFGSRQEEAQRLGRLLRPKPGSNQAHFYTLVTRDTKEQEFALNRQRFLCEQGYTYEIVDRSDPT